MDAERECLVAWASEHNAILDFAFVEQFKRVSAGAEHVVYHDAVRKCAIKTTHPNSFGHCTFGPGYQAMPSEYLNRLAWQNVLFGDNIRVLGVVAGEDHIEVVTSQPWISLHSSRPSPFQHEIDHYFQSLTFARVPWSSDVPLYWSEELNLVAMDAHMQNVVRDSTGQLVAIDIVVGQPGKVFLSQIKNCFGIQLEFWPK